MKVPLPEGKVLQFRPRDANAPSLVARGRSKNPCSEAPWHAAVVDVANRTVECAVCGAELDPFEVLNRVALDEEKYRWMQAETRRLASEVSDLTQERKRLKDAVRAAQKRLAP